MAGWKKYLELAGNHIDQGPAIALKDPAEK